MGDNRVSEARMAGIMNAIRKAGGLKALKMEKRHFGVLMVMAYFEDDVTGDCWPSCKTIGLFADQDRDRVATNRTELEKKGYIIEDQPRRRYQGNAPIKYWLWNEDVFPKVRIAICNTLLTTRVANGEMQHELHCTALHKKEERISKVIDGSIPSG
jgi:hypothetical protein